MSRLRVASFSVSLDGYGVGANQSVQEPLGVGGESLHGWLVGTRMFRELYGQEGGSTGVDVVKLGYEVAEHVATDAATHVVLKKRS